MSSFLSYLEKSCSQLKSPCRYEFGYLAHATKFLLHEFGLEKKIRDEENHR